LKTQSVNLLTQMTRQIRENITFNQMIKESFRTAKY
jgi:hypothetical protein